MPLHLSSVSDGKDINNLFEYKILEEKSGKIGHRSRGLWRKIPENPFSPYRKSDSKQTSELSERTTDRQTASFNGMAERSQTGYKM